MSKKAILLFVSGLLMVGLLYAGGAAEQAEVSTGRLVDEITWTAEPDHAAAVRKLQAGDIDVYAFGITKPDLFEDTASDPNLSYGFSYGGYRDLRFNTYGPFFSEGGHAGELNPFSVPRIREAMNWLIDRDYIVDEYLGGMGQAKYTALGTAFADHLERYPHIIRAIEDYYAYDKEKARQVITEEMEKLGCELVDGVWSYEGSPVVIRALIRADLAPWPEGGHYVADQLEDIGFQVDRAVRIGSEASPIWIGSHPNLGLMHVYTGGWGSPVINRDGGTIFDQMYTHRVMQGFALWGILEEQLKDFPEFDESSRRLKNKEFSSMAEREQLFETVLWEAMKFSNCIWVLDTAGFNPYRSDVKVAVDVAGGIGDPGWVFTAHRVGKDGRPMEGASLRMETNNLLTDPWNPVAGSSWTYDMMITRRAVGGIGFVTDPRDGLVHPHRVKSAEVFAKSGLPIGITHDWLTLEFVDEIKVPEDAWSDWDAAKQEWITVAQRFPAGVTAQTKVILTYDDDLFTNPLHDGSTFSMGDIVMGMLLGFDRAKPESPIFDQATVGSFEADMAVFRGLKIVSESPLVIEYYTDWWHLDAELIASNADQYPMFGTYLWSGYWHMISLGILAETGRELAFTKSKADELEVEWMDYTKGPSLAILKRHMDKAAADRYIPYAPTLGRYISASEAAGRWSNMQSFYDGWGHFWVGSGPYIIKDVRAVEKIVTIAAFEDYPDPRDKWFFFLEPLME